MLVRVSASKSTKVQTACLNLLDSKHITIQDVADVIGLLVSSLPAVQFGELYYSKLEVNKSNAVRQNKGDFDATMTLLTVRVIVLDKKSSPFT